MTQQGPNSTPGRPGQMTAVMRAVSVASGPKVLRIGLVQSGRVIEERVIKQRTTVTIGPSEKNTFVILAPNLPSSFKILELVGPDYHLNFTDQMNGRIALATGPTDLNALKVQAKKPSQGVYQIKLTDDAHGKIVLGETTLLFQFVQPPPVQPKPQLPASVRSGVADEIDWSMTIIAAFSFLFHFGAVGTLYSDWADKVIPDEADVRGLVEQISRLPPPPPAETPQTADTATATSTAKTEAPKTTGGATGKTTAGQGGAGGKLSADKKAAMFSQLDAMNTATIAAVGQGGSATKGVLDSGNVPTGPLDAFANAGTGVQAGGLGNLPGGGGGGAMIPGQEGGGLANLGGGTKGSAAGEGAGQAAAVAAPKPVVGGGGSVSSGKLSNSSRTLAGAKARARGCYQAGLSQNADMEGGVSFTLVVSSSGSVTSANVSPSGSISSSVAGCIKSALSGLQFDAPDGGSATVTGSFTFVNGNKGK